VTRRGRNGKLQAAANNPSVNVHKPRCGAVLFCTLLKKDVPPRAAEFGLIEPAQAHIPKMTLRDHQAKSLHCRKLRNHRPSRTFASRGQEYSNEISVERVPDGFKMIPSEYGSSFYCATCENSVDQK
jgi:hypothetical protein